jgi:hypothetical protein
VRTPETSAQSGPPELGGSGRATAVPAALARHGIRGADVALPPGAGLAGGLVMGHFGREILARLAERREGGGDAPAAPARTRSRR